MVSEDKTPTNGENEHTGGGGLVRPMNEFRECETCHAKPGMPLLCTGCLINRTTIGNLQEQIVKLNTPDVASETDGENLEIVRWLDARSEDAWAEPESLDMRVAEIVTLGHVVRETDDVLCIASSKDGTTGQVSGIMFIPKRCVLSRRGVSVGERIEVAAGGS